MKFAIQFTRVDHILATQPGLLSLTYLLLMGRQNEVIGLSTNLGLVAAFVLLAVVSTIITMLTTVWSEQANEKGMPWELKQVKDKSELYAAFISSVAVPLFLLLATPKEFGQSPWSLAAFFGNVVFGYTISRMIWSYLLSPHGEG